MEGILVFLLGVCQGQAVIQTGYRVDFVHCHVRDTVVSMKDRNLPHPR